MHRRLMLYLSPDDQMLPKIISGNCTGINPTSGSGQEGFKFSRVEPGQVAKRHGSGREVFGYHVSSRVTLTRSDPREVT